MAKEFTSPESRLLFHIIDMLSWFLPQTVTSPNLFGFRQEKHGIGQFLVADGSLHIAGFRYGGRIKLIAHGPIAPIIGTCPMVLVGMNQRFTDRHMVFGSWR